MNVIPSVSHVTDGDGNRKHARGVDNNLTTRTAGAAKRRHEKDDTRVKNKEKKGRPNASGYEQRGLTKEQNAKAASKTRYATSRLPWRPMVTRFGARSGAQTRRDTAQLHSLGNASSVPVFSICFPSYPGLAAALGCLSLRSSFHPQKGVARRHEKDVSP